MAPAGPAFVYVDNGNLWIEGMKLAARRAGLQTSTDPRLRIHLAKFAAVLCRELQLDVSAGVVYAASRAAAHGVWASVRHAVGWSVHTHAPSACSGREKQVDGQIIADITERACTTSPPGTIVLVSGDADMLPALEKAAARAWDVVVVGWKHAVSAALLRVPAVRVMHLDAFFDEVTYTVSKFPAHDRRLPRDRAFVLRGVDGSDEAGVLAAREWLDTVTKWPWQVRTSAGGLVTGVVFCMQRTHAGSMPAAASHDLSHPPVVAICRRVARALDEHGAPACGLEALVPLFGPLSRSWPGTATAQVDVGLDAHGPRNAPL